MSDARTRQDALNADRSFIVQAPAGSGKTELLIQRYLTLLAGVDEPEQIVAITFTRKAAAEMRQRIAGALRDAAAGVETADPHRAGTLALAQRALARSDARGWALPEHARRLRIETLDALNARLASRLPTLSGGVAGAAVTDDASRLYAAAAERTLDALVGDAELTRPLRRLLAHFDYSASRLEALLAQLLPKREQWLALFTATEAGALRSALENALARLVAEEIERAARRIPRDWRTALPALLEHAAARSSASWDARHDPGDPDARDARTAAGVRDQGGARGARAAPGVRNHDGTLALDRLDVWRAAADLLLTKQDGWRRRLDRRLGFGPDHPQERARLSDLLASVADDDALRAMLAELRRLPDPEYSEQQWQVLEDLRIVLRRAAAELRLVFAERQAVDFVELALAAQHALGTSDAPSDLLLAVDYRVQHILVDEFQDTSHGQLRLLETLTAGWTPGDGRTLFLVGDPMQSIYRFRDADMSLFLKVRRDGLGGVPCEPLMLTRNFRSAPAVVDWINATFARAFPSEDDLGRGEVSFAPCIATRAASEQTDVIVHAIRSDEDAAEVDAVLDVIAQERRARPAQSLAVLVQSRAHLAGAHDRLRERGLPVNAVEIEPLREQQVVQDLVGLTRALLHPADRIAWLAVLHAPWCGLGWRDLALLTADQERRSMWDVIHDPDIAARLDGDARTRLECTVAALDDAICVRGESALAGWIERAWRMLDGPEWLESAAEHAAAEQFFASLTALARRGDLDDPAALDAALSGPRPEPEPTPGAIEIMTIHKAKGLEFDCVVLLGLGRETRRDEQRALYWMERVAADGREDLLMAPLPAPGSQDRLSALIRTTDEQREAAERTRLLYVAATRAKARLHLVGRIGSSAEAPPSRSLLATIWSAVEDRFGPACAPLAPAVPTPAWVDPKLRRFADGFEREHVRPAAAVTPAEAPTVPSPDDVTAATAAPRLAVDTELEPEYEWAGLAAMQVGTLVHARLQRIAADGLDAWTAADIELARDDLGRELALLGVDRTELGDGLDTVVRALTAVLDDDRGRWLLAAHEDARSELELTIERGGYLERLKLDRTFVDAGTRWIVDFKTGRHEGGDLDAFLNAEVERYRPQLERYAAAMREIDARPIKVGLYFPLLRAFRAWSPS